MWVGLLPFLFLIAAFFYLTTAISCQLPGSVSAFTAWYFKICMVILTSSSICYCILLVRTEVKPACYLSEHHSGYWWKCIVFFSILYFRTQLLGNEIAVSCHSAVLAVWLGSQLSRSFQKKQCLFLSQQHVIRMVFSDFALHSIQQQIKRHRLVRIYSRLIVWLPTERRNLPAKLSAWSTSCLPPAAKPVLEDQWVPRGKQSAETLPLAKVLLMTHYCHLWMTRWSTRPAYPRDKLAGTPAYLNSLVTANDCCLQ